MRKRLGSGFIAAVMIACLVLGVVPLSAQAAGGVISSVEITQVMGKGVDLGSGNYYFMNMFVAEKPTSVQVVMTAPVTINPNTMRLEIYYEGGSQPLATVKPANSGQQQIIDFIPGKGAVNGWQSGRYKFVASIDGEESATEAIFNTSKSYSVLFVAGEVRFDGVVYNAPPINSSTVQLRAQIFPVAEDKFLRKFRKASIQFGTDGGGYDIATSEGQMMLLNDIEQYRHKSAPGYDAVVALVNAPLNAAESVTGYTNSEHAAVVTLNGNPSLSDLEATVAHELGHIFSNGDEYENGDARVNVNGLPYGVAASENGQPVTGRRSYLESVTGNSYSGILLHRVQNAYNPKTGVPVQNVSSFMGSSYTHWPTSMVWEQMYKRLVPNYENVLPRVYTDGTIVATRTRVNDLTDQELNALRSEFRQMLNEVRVKAGKAPYPDDEIMAAGDAAQQRLAEEALAQGLIGELIDLDTARNAMFAQLSMRCSEYQGNAGLYPYESDELEQMRGFYSQSPCGISALKSDYLFLAFVRANGTVYYMRATYSDFYPTGSGDEYMEPQPEVQPVLEMNPVTGQPVREEDYGQFVPPAGSDIGATSETGGSQGGGANETGGSQGETPQEPENTAFASLPRGEMVARLALDQFDLGYIQSNLGDYSYDELLAFYSWYTNDCYGVVLTPDAIGQALSEASDRASAEYDGMGEREFALAYEYVCRAFGLYPPQEFRSHELYAGYCGPVRPNYGDNPVRSRHDTDEISYDRSNDSDEDIKDPDGGW